MPEISLWFNEFVVNSFWTTAIGAFLLGFIPTSLSWFFDHQSQKRQIAHELDLQRKQLRHGDAPSKIEIIEKFIRALKAAYDDLEEYKYAIDGEKANGQHSRHYAEQGHWAHAEKFENHRIRDVERRIEVNGLIRQHIEDLNAIRLSITGIAPEYRDDAQNAIDEYQGHRGTLYLLPEGDSALKYSNYDVQKWEKILASIRSEH